MWIPLMYEDGGECDTCGPSWDELTVEFDAAPGEKGPWHACLTTGCFGGAEFTGSRAGVIDWLTKECARLVEPDVLAQAIEQLRNA